VLYYIFNTLLISLFVMHIYWWILIFRMLVKQVAARGRVSDDVRSGTTTPSARLHCNVVILL
jgi:ceramide synthetase